MVPAVHKNLLGAIKYFDFDRDCNVLQKSCCGEQFILKALLFLFGSFFLFSTSATLAGKLADRSIKACEMRNPVGCLQAGEYFTTGVGVIINLRLARQYYVKACDQRHARGCLEAGRNYSAGFGKKGLAKSHNLAATFYMKACDGDNAEGCYEAGILYGLGKGVDKDQSRAVKLHHKACRRYIDKACFSAGVHYAEGKGVEKDQSRAKQLFVLACNGGIADGCKNAGVEADTGDGDIPDNLAKSNKSPGSGGADFWEKLAGRVWNNSGGNDSYNAGSKFPNSADIRGAIQKIAVGKGMRIVTFKLNNCYKKKDSGKYLCHLNATYKGNNPLSSLVAGIVNFEGGFWADFRSGSNAWYHVQSFTGCTIRNDTANCEYVK